MEPTITQKEFLERRGELLRRSMPIGFFCGLLSVAVILLVYFLPKSWQTILDQQIPSNLVTNYIPAKYLIGLVILLVLLFFKSITRKVMIRKLRLSCPKCKLYLKDGAAQTKGECPKCSHQYIDYHSR